jgi:hypothetical protein
VSLREDKMMRKSYLLMKNEDVKGKPVYHHLSRETFVAVNTRTDCELFCRIRKFAI